MNTLKEMKEQVAIGPFSDRIDVLIKSIAEKEDRNGRAYLVISMTDGETSVTANYFGVGKTDVDFAEGDICNALVSVSLYQGNPNFNINEMIKIQPTKELQSKLCKTSPLTYKDMMTEIIQTVKSFTNEEYKTLVLHVLKENTDKLKYWSAAKAVHHAYRTGLLYHMYRMMKAAEALCGVYTEANKELVVSVCLLHDVGKLKEIETSQTGVGVYTVEGELFGHLYLGAEYVRQIAKEIGVSETTAMEIAAIIVSHHERPEYGAIKTPQSLEAFLVSEIDKIDSRVDIYNDEYKSIEPGEIGEKNYFLDGICYKNHMTEE